MCHMSVRVTINSNVSHIFHCPIQFIRWHAEIFVCYTEILTTKLIFLCFFTSKKTEKNAQKCFLRSQFYGVDCRHNIINADRFNSSLSTSRRKLFCLLNFFLQFLRITFFMNDFFGKLFHRQYHISYHVHFLASCLKTFFLLRDKKYIFTTLFPPYYI